MKPSNKESVTVFKRVTTLHPESEKQDSTQEIQQPTNEMTEPNQTKPNKCSTNQ